MSGSNHNSQNEKSDVNNAVDNLEPQDLQNNLEEDAGSNKHSQNLTEVEKSPFIDDKLRTDK